MDPEVWRVLLGCHAQIWQAIEVLYSFFEEVLLVKLIELNAHTLAEVARC